MPLSRPNRSAFVCPPCLQDDHSQCIKSPNTPCACTSELHYPPKRIEPGIMVDPVPGEHVWIVLVGYRLSDDEVLQSHQPRDKVQPVIMGPERAVSTSPPLCLWCEKLWAEAHAEPCTGDPTEAQAQVDFGLYKDEIDRLTGG